MARRRTWRTVVVTGGGGGIGRALSLRFARDGAAVGVVDRDGAAAAATAEAITAGGGRAVGVACDVTDADGVERAFSELHGALGPTDVLVNNAGITHRSRFSETRVEVLRRVLDVNLFGAVHCTRAALPALRERRGLVVVLSSIAGLAPLPARSGYCASKHALHGLFETLRLELAPTGVGVMLVCPGFTATAIERNALGPDGRPATRPQSRVGRQATPEQVADAIVRGAARDRRLVVLSGAGRLARWLHTLAPGLFERGMRRAFASELEPAAGSRRRGGAGGPGRD